MRSCQPGPPSWKKSSTSRSMRSETSSLAPGRGAADLGGSSTALVVAFLNAASAVSRTPFDLRSSAMVITLRTMPIVVSVENSPPRRRRQMPLILALPLIALPSQLLVTLLRVRRERDLGDGLLLSRRRFLESPRRRPGRLGARVGSKLRKPLRSETSCFGIARFFVGVSLLSGRSICTRGGRLGG